MSENETGNDTPVSDTLLVMTAASLDNSDLSPRELMIARTAALVAVDAPAASYALNAVPAADSGITLDDVEDVLVAVAPIVGTSPHRLGNGENRRGTRVRNRPGRS